MGSNLARLPGRAGTRTAIAEARAELTIEDELLIAENSLLRRGLNLEAQGVIRARIAVMAASRLLDRYYALYGELPPADDGA